MKVNVIDWDGSHIPEALRELPPGRTMSASSFANMPLEVREYLSLHPPERAAST